MISYLVDTHVLLWWAEDPDFLSKEVRLCLSSGYNQIYASYVSAWEIAIKRSRKRLAISQSGSELIARARFTPLSITLRHIESVKDLPHIHGDPFDRLLVAQAQEERLTLVTRDKNMLQYDVPTLVA